MLAMANVFVLICLGERAKLCSAMSVVPTTLPRYNTIWCKSMWMIDILWLEIIFCGPWVNGIFSHGIAIIGGETLLGRLPTLLLDARSVICLLQAWVASLQTCSSSSMEIICLWTWTGSLQTAHSPWFAFLTNQNIALLLLNRTLHLSLTFFFLYPLPS